MLRSGGGVGGGGSATSGRAAGLDSAGLDRTGDRSPEQAAQAASATRSRFAFMATSIQCWTSSRRTSPLVGRRPCSMKGAPGAPPVKLTP